MNVRLVGYTQPAEEFRGDFSDISELITFCARVSNPSNQMNTETASKLIKYLLKHKHFSPFEMASITIEVETTRDIARQLLRHRSFSFQEFSQRYADPTQMSFVIREARMQDTTNRQKSIPLSMEDNHHRQLAKEWEYKQQALIEHAKDVYKWALGRGIAKEQARVVLPEGCTPSKLYVCGSIRSFIHYIEVRTDESTQEEHRQLALAIAEVVSRVFRYDE